MSVQEVVYAALTGDVAYAALITGGLWQDHVPDHVTYPAAAYRQISATPDGSGGCMTTRIEVDHLARSPGDVDAMCEALHDVVDGLSNWGWLDDGPDLFEDDAGLGLYRRPVDLLIST